MTRDMPQSAAQTFTPLQAGQTSPSPAGASTGAVASQRLRFSAMDARDIETVAQIEKNAYAFPWGRESFLDSLGSGYQLCVAHDSADIMVGYFVMMMVVDEAHLLNITVAPEAQRQGHGLALLEKAMSRARDGGMASVLLEVRPSNERAIGIYRRRGFVQIGVRRHYYPAPAGTREDAIIMRCPT